MTWLPGRRNLSLHLTAGSPWPWEEGSKAPVGPSQQCQSAPGGAPLLFQLPNPVAHAGGSRVTLPVNTFQETSVNKMREKKAVTGKNRDEFDTVGAPLGY